MTDLNTLLVRANVRRALVVDDVCDAIPLATDLALDGDEWTHFFEDLNDDDRTLLREIYADFDKHRADDLPTVDEFVGSLWSSRERLRPELIEPLFSRYVTDATTDRAYIESLVAALVGFGLTCETAGREFQDKGANADLIIIDLYLGAAQDDAAIRTSINGLIKVIETRAVRPPLVILMSRSNLLSEKRKEFRDRTGLFESAFRIIRKSELSDQGKLSRTLTRLASHYADSLKLAAFLTAWQVGLREASKRTASLIKTLDLADHAQIRHLLLSAEGEPTGSYLVDVFDRVLQYEIEREADIIAAAIALNALTSETYPPPYVAGSRNLQDIVYRSLFQNRERLRLSGAEGSRVAFGDLLGRKLLPPDVKPEPAQRALLSDIGENNVLAVLTPACDLQRTGAKRVLLLVGELMPLGPADWSYKDDPIRTPVVELGGDQRYWIRWDIRHIETLSHADLETLLGEAGAFSVVSRLREAHALELQQKLLSNLGRVGLIAPMPATFRMKVEAYLPNIEKKLARVDVPVLQATEAVCYVGRVGRLEQHRLVLCEEACDAVCVALEDLDLQGIHPNAREPIEYLKGSGELLQALERGVELPGTRAQNFKDIASPTGAVKADGRSRVLGLITRNRSVDNSALSAADVNKAGIVLAVWDDLPAAGE